MSQTNQALLSGFKDAILVLQSADARNNKKGDQLKQWVSTNFGESARVSIVNKAKQAGNRAKEQLSQRDVINVIFFVTNDDAFDPLVRHCKSLFYPALRTVFFAYAGGAAGELVPKLLLRNPKKESKLANFYMSAFPQLKVEDVELEMPVAAYEEDIGTHEELVENPIVPSLLTDEDPIILDVKSLLDDDYAGVIFTGAPGASKSWYARQVALKIVDGKTANLFFIQFHPGYQYEDFIESYVPTEVGGFALVDKIFLKACDAAREQPDDSIVVVIDELSRTDVVRVFGEALTYIERDKRDLEFRLPSGRICSIPQNLIILCTMNPWDRGVDELDLAFERRFAKIRFDPDLERLRIELQKSSLSEERRQLLEQFFSRLANHPNKLCRLGHAYFMKAKTDESLQRLWDHQLVFHFEKILKNDEEQLGIIHSAWKRIFQEQPQPT